MSALTRLALRRPKVAVAIWVVLVLLLAGAAKDAQDKVSETSFDLPGTASSEALKAQREAFGRSELVPIMLEGPAAQLDRQGPRLVDQLRERYTVISPWDSGEGLDRLRPSGERALVLTNLSHSADQKSADMLRPLERATDEAVSDPVRSYVTGLPVLTEALNDTTIDANDKAAKLAFPALLIVLLFVFRSLAAAAIPAIVGATTVVAGTGVISSLTGSFDLTALSISLVSMMGLALGVDYTLLIVSRFREEIARPGADPKEAAATAAATAGRTVLFAGLALALAMGLGLLLSPGDILVSAATGVLVAVVLSTVTAIVIVPAVLSLLGTNINRGKIGSVGLESRRLAGLARWAMARPVPVVTGFLVLLLALAVPATGLKSDPSNVRLLPEDNQVRQDYERIERAFGPGYISPFEVVLSSREDSISGGDALAQVSEFADEVSRDPVVLGVLGPAEGGSGGVDARLASSAPPSSSAAAGGARVADPGAQGAFVVNEERGDDAARVFVFPKTFPNSQESRDLRDRLETRADAAGTAIGGSGQVGGLSGRFVDYDEVTSARLPVIIVGLSLVTYLLLVPMLRAVVLPGVAILLNLVTVAAAFGVLALLFDGSSPPLGGPGFLDVISLIGIFTVIFALSIDYEVFLLTRIREAYLRLGDTSAAIEHGVSRTAGVVTGAALIMCAVFIAFALSGFVTIRQFGVGLTAAVLLDAFVLRLVLLPAVMRLLGERNWWLPGWLDRLLPNWHVEGADAPKESVRQPAPATEPGG